MRRLPDRRETDQSFADFLRRQPGGRTLAANRRLARGFVEGFHAADVERDSAVSLHEAGSPAGDEREQRLGSQTIGTERIGHGVVTRIVLLFDEALWADERFASRTGIPGDLLNFLQGAATVRLKRLLRGSWYHDWNRDPYAQGAYSYQVVGGGDATSALARPVGGRLFFAGEATDTEGATGTVHGAISSGRRAARQVKRALNRHVG
jgi:hypothetical protein